MQKHSLPSVSIVLTNGTICQIIVRHRSKCCFRATRDWLTRRCFSHIHAYAGTTALNQENDTENVALI